MRNLKRALALALSSVMLMGMMVVGTSAAGYDDVTAAHDAEAIEVMQAIDVMVGDDAGNFNPDQKVTRAEAAVVIAKLMDLSVEDFNGSDLTFTDVPEWAVPFVAAVQAEGIIAGYDAKTFGSNDTVTAAQYALMTMKVLGYFQFDSDYNGNWEMATASQAGKIDLFDGVSAGVKTPLTREQVARITLNALESATVYEDGMGLTVESGDLTIVSAHKYREYNANGGKWDAINAKNGYKELGEDLFDGDLTKYSARDDLGRPATRWDWKGEKVGVYAETASQTVVITDSKYNTVELAYLEMVNDDFDKAILNVQNNGVYVNVDDTVVVGDKVEYFLNDKGEIKTAAIIRYSATQIKDIDTDVKKADKADGVTCYVDLGVKDANGDAIILKDTKIAGFDAETYVEDAYILYALNAKGDKVIASELAKELTGEVEATKNGKVKIDGEWYKDLTASLSIGDKVCAYLDLADQIVKIDDKVNASEDYAYIRHIYEDTSKDGLGTKTYTAYVVLTDGTAASYVVEEDSVAKLAIGLAAYSVNAKGELVIEAMADKYDVVTATIDKNNADIAGKYNANAKTEFVFWYVDANGKLKTDVATGYKGVKIAAESVTVVYEDDSKDALYVFVNNANGTVTSDMLLAVLADDAYSVKKDANGDKYYTYDVIIDGEETTLNTDCEVLPVAKGAAFAYTLDKDGFVNIGAAKDDAKQLESGKLEVANDDYIRVAGVGMFNLGDEVRNTIVIEWNKTNSKIIDITVKDGAALDKDDNVYVHYETNNGVKELEAIYLIKVIK